MAHPIRKKVIEAHCPQCLALIENSQKNSALIDDLNAKIKKLKKQNAKLFSDNVQMIEDFEEDRTNKGEY